MLKRLFFRASTRAHASPNFPCSQLQICLQSVAIVIHLKGGVLHQENLSAVILSRLTTRNLLCGLGLVPRLSGNRMSLQNTVSGLVECQQGIYIRFAQTNMYLRFLTQLSKKLRLMKKSQLYLMTTSNAAVRAAREIPTVSTTLDRTSGKTRVFTSGPLPFLFIDQFAQEKQCGNFSEQRKLDPVQTQIVELENIQWGCGCAKEDLSLLFPNPCCLEFRSHMLCKCITPSTDLC